MQIKFAKLSRETVNSAGEGADEALEFEEHEVGRDVAIGQFGLHDDEVDMQAFFCLLQFVKDGLLPLRKVVHQSNELRLNGLSRGVARFPVHSLDEVIGGVDELGAGVADQLVAALGRLIIGATGESE